MTKEAMPGATELSELLSNLAKSGASQYFLEIRRRCPGLRGRDKLWERWKYNVPADDLDDIRDYCYSEGGQEWEYKIWVRDGAGNPVVGPGGKKVGPFVLPALAAPPPEMASKMAGLPEDPEMVDRMKELKRRRLELDIQRQEMALERERRRLEKMHEEEDDDEDRWYDPRYAPPPWAYQPWMQQGMLQQQRSSDAVELAKAFAPVLVTVLANKSGDKLTQADLVKLLLERGKDNGWSPKDMIGFIAPLMAEVTKVTGDVNKIAMERMADSDQFWKEKLIEAAKLGGAGEDEIEKWRKILGLATDTIREGAKLMFGRPTILKAGVKGGEVNVPVIEKARPPGLPVPSSSHPGREVNPAEEAKRIAKERVVAFLVAHEQEMLIGSDPVLVAEKLDELYAMLPLPLRCKIESSDTAGIYEALREYSAEIVDRILAAVAEDKTGQMKRHCEEFWEAIKHPEGDDGAEDEGGGEELQGVETSEQS